VGEYGDLSTFFAPCLVQDLHFVVGQVKPNSGLTPNTTLIPSMNAAHSPGEYQTRTPARPINGTDIPIGYASSLWVKLTLGGIQRRVCGLFKRITGAGWKSLPQELVDEILSYLLDDMDALKACSLTCKRLFGATRPLIHQRLVCLDTRPRFPTLRQARFSRKRDPGTFERLADADRLGVLCYTRHLTLKPTDVYTKLCFGQRDLQEYLPQLRSITRLDSLTLESFYLSLFAPFFDTYFGIFANTLRHLDIRRAQGGGRDLLYIISKFPLLEDLTIISPGGGFTTPPIPAITRSPPFRGKLVLVNSQSGELSEGLAAFPGGLNFRSLELASCNNPQPVLVACGHTAASVSYLWRRGYNHSESNPLLRCIL